VQAAEWRKAERSKEPTPTNDQFYVNQFNDDHTPNALARKHLTPKQLGLLKGKLKGAGVADDNLINTVNALLSLGGHKPVTVPGDLTNQTLDYVLANLDKIVTVEQFTSEDYIDATGK
jgi:hypothetical protein